MANKGVGVGRVVAVPAPTAVASDPLQATNVIASKGITTLSATDRAQDRARHTGRRGERARFSVTASTVPLSFSHVKQSVPHKLEVTVGQEGQWLLGQDKVL